MKKDLNRLTHWVAFYTVIEGSPHIHHLAGHEGEPAQDDIDLVVANVEYYLKRDHGMTTRTFKVKVLPFIPINSLETEEGLRELDSGIKSAILKEHFYN